jgi:hypothetical protein
LVQRRRRHRRREEAGRLVDLECLQDLELRRGGLGALEHPAGGAVELAQVQARELAPDRRPGLPGLDLDHAGEQEGEEAEQHVRADPLLLAVVDGAQVERVLERSPGALDLEQLLVAERQLLGRERVVGRGEQELAVQALLGVHLLLVDDEPAAAANEVAAEARVREQERLGVPAIIVAALASSARSRRACSRAASCGLRQTTRGLLVWPLPTRTSLPSRLSRTRL